MHTKAGTGFCLGKSYRRRCRGKVRGRELGKSGTFFGACMILEGKQAINSGAKLRRGKKKRWGTCVLTGDEKWLGEKEGFEISGKHL